MAEEHQKDKVQLITLGIVGVVAIVAIFFGFMSYGKNAGFVADDNADLVGQASLPLASEDFENNEQADAELELPAADFPGIETA